MKIINKCVGPGVVGGVAGGIVVTVTVMGLILKIPPIPKGIVWIVSGVITLERYINHAVRCLYSVAA